MVLANDSTEPVTVQAVELASESLANSRHATDRAALESSSRRNLETLKSIGMAVTVGATAMTGAAVVAAAATASAVSAILGGTAAAGAGMFVTVVPIIGVIGGGLYAHKGPHARLAGDRAAIAYEMERSGLRLPASLGPASELRGSAFFPVTPAPTQLRVRYEMQGETRELALELNALSALHLRARKP